MDVRTISAIIAPLLVTGLAGWSSLGKPVWLEPGTARSQQRRAVRFDPFQQTDVRHDHLSIMDGTRPRDYAEPVIEVKRPRWWAQPLTPKSGPPVTDSPIYR
jgi:hypothetical protein